MEQPQHLSIKDIGIILERLNSKIIDVERLDRAAEGSDTHNWTLKATIRGDVMRELVSLKAQGFCYRRLELSFHIRCLWMCLSHCIAFVNINLFEF